MISAPRAAELREIVGDRNVLDGHDAEPFLDDFRHQYNGARTVVVRPGSTAEVSAVVSWCAANAIAVVSQGGNTGMSGGATVGHERQSVLLSLTRMSAIESIDVGRSTMTVQSGATISSLHEAAAAHGRLFAPDWGARGSATIGGGIATDAGGNNVVRYGNMRDHIMGLEVVLADGRIWNGLRALRKDSSGYDLKQLFIGSEGTLGVITRAVVKLLPATPHVQSAWASLRDLDDLAAVSAIAAASAGPSLTAFELIPDIGVDRVCEVFDMQRPIEAPSEFHVLLKLAASSPVTDTLTSLLAELADQNLIIDAVVASSTAQEEHLWAIRDELSPPALFRHIDEALKMDTAVPVDRITDLFHSVRRIAASTTPTATCYGFGHVGDGNIHMYVIPDPDDLAGFRRNKTDLVAAIDQATFDLGGTLSAEHGVGIELRDRVQHQKDPIEWELMRAVKATLDPANMMNPGKLLPD